MILFKMLSRGVISVINGCISTGKEVRHHQYSDQYWSILWDVLINTLISTDGYSSILWSVLIGTSHCLSCDWSTVRSTCCVILDTIVHNDYLLLINLLIVTQSHRVKLEEPAVEPQRNSGSIDWFSRWMWSDVFYRPMFIMPAPQEETAEPSRSTRPRSCCSKTATNTSVESSGQSHHRTRVEVSLTTEEEFRSLLTVNVT